MDLHRSHRHSREGDGQALAAHRSRPRSRDGVARTGLPPRCLVQRVPIAQHTFRASFYAFRCFGALLHQAFLVANQVTINHTADWWLGDLDDPWFKALETAVREEWGVEPLRIREGGVRFFFQPHPLGQSCTHTPADTLSFLSLVHPIRSLLGKDVSMPRTSPSARSELGTWSCCCCCCACACVWTRQR